MATNKEFNKKSANKNSPRKKSKLKKYGMIGGGVFVALIIMMLFAPRQGTIKYGICRTYVELHELYPQSIQVINGEEDGNTVRIDYKRTDPFGLEAFNTIVCRYKDTEDGSIQLAKIDINGEKRQYPQEDPEEVRKFNLGIPAIIAGRPSLVMPYAWTKDIKTYR